MKKVILLSMLFAFTGTVNAEIYKWVDDNGVTHYGSKKPTKKNASEMNVRNSSNKTKKVSPEVKDMANGIAAGLMKDHGDAKKVNCSKAVRNAKSGIDTMLSVGKRNLASGHLGKSEYNKMSTELKRLNARVSMSECKGASGRTLGFYKCMSNNYNHVASCGKKYNYGF